MFYAIPPPCDHWSQIVTESWGTHLLIYLYDAEGSPIGMQYRNTSYAKDYFQTFWFEKNLQGDIVAVYNANGVKLISYTYDAWGNFATTYYNSCNPTSVASYNPFRYRGYYYDNETGLYYLQSRYYDSAVGRFLNADTVFDYDAGFPGYNLFVYCGNEPVFRIDISGADSNKADDDQITDEEMKSWGSGGGGPLIGGLGSGTSFAYAYNPMDAGYSHHIDLSIASNSSSFSSGILSNGYTAYTSSTFLSAGSSTTIYRWNCTNAKNLRPSNKDVSLNSGLSFSTQYRPGSAMTTIEQINATGVLFAQQDGKSHISIYPIGGTIEAWHNGGVNSIWTKALSSVVEFID